MLVEIDCSVEHDRSDDDAEDERHEEGLRDYVTLDTCVAERGEHLMRGRCRTVCASGGTQLPQ